MQTDSWMAETKAVQKVFGLVGSKAERRGIETVARTAADWVDARAVARVGLSVEHSAVRRVYERVVALVAL